jgi:hypothetical protein
MANRPPRPEQSELCWHGWPPQVWNGKTWKPIPQAELLIKLTKENKQLRALLEENRALLEARKQPRRL